jgi:F420-0:gamma-glutamyl ligase
MKVTAIKTEKVLSRSTTLTAFLDRRLKKFPDCSILAITSKVVALCEGRVVPLTKIKESTLKAEADYYLPKEKSRYGVPITIKDNAFIARAGMDASNTGGYYSLLPKDSYRTSKRVRTYLIKRFGIKNAGVIIVDSHSAPLRRGVTGVAIGWSGFHGLKGYEHVPDIFGTNFTTHANHVDALATSASLAMGEGNEQTPLVTITDIPFIGFASSSPTKKELAYFKPVLADDLFAPLLNFKKLKKGKKNP